MFNLRVWLLTALTSCIAPVTPTCELELSLETVDLVNEPGVEVVAWVTNTTPSDLTFSFNRPCPDGAARFTGWDSMDFYGTCGGGVCDPILPIETLTLAAGEAVAISRMFNDAPKVSFDGNACNDPVPSGTEVEISFWIDELVGATSCGPNPILIAVP